jgi:hypothetical protein
VPPPPQEQEADGEQVPVAEAIDRGNVKVWLEGDKLLATMNSPEAVSFTAKWIEMVRQAGPPLDVRDVGDIGFLREPTVIKAMDAGGIDVAQVDSPDDLRPVGRCGEGFHPLASCRDLAERGATRDHALFLDSRSLRFEQVPPRSHDLEQLIRWQVRKAAPFSLIFSSVFGRAMSRRPSASSRTA